MGDERWFEPWRIDEYTSLEDTPVRRRYQEMWEAMLDVGEMDENHPYLSETVEEAQEAIARFVDAILRDCGCGRADDPS